MQVEWSGEVIPVVGMKKEADIMNSTQIATVRAHVAAVSKLLLGDKILKPSLMIIAGEDLTLPDRLEYARVTAETDIDIVYLTFAIDADGEPVMTGITVFLPRDGISYAWTGCRLSLLPGQARAVLDPQDNMRGHFRILPGEIVQVNSKPAALARGAVRAAHRLAALVRNGVDLTGQVVLNDFVIA